MASIEEGYSSHERFDVAFNDHHWEQGLATVNRSNPGYTLSVNYLPDAISRVANGKLTHGPRCREVSDASLGMWRKRVGEVSYEIMVGAADSDGGYIVIVGTMVGEMVL